MYCQALYVESTDHRTGVGKNNSELWEVKLKDMRPKKDGGEYTAFMLKATFWGSTQPCSTGEYILVSGDLVYNYWKDKNDVLQSTAELRDPKILNMTNGRDETPKKEESTEEIPF